MPTPTDTIAIFGVIAVIIGWFITAIVSRRVAVESFRRDVKRKLYDSFIEEVWKTWFELPKNADGQPVTNVELSKYSNKIALYGSPNVVSLLAKAMLGGSSDEENIRDMTNLINEMRLDVGERVSDKTSDDIRVILYRVPAPPATPARSTPDSADSA